uniref:Uncharacterized protein n=1 Tax=Fagus sylvatica TaxID=28930 RepID=A0A2N9H570_FAGSY
MSRLHQATCRAQELFAEKLAEFTYQGKKLTKAHVVHLDCIKHLLGFDASLLGLHLSSVGPVRPWSDPSRLRHGSSRHPQALSRPCLGFIKPHAELKSSLQETHQVCTSEGKELIKAHVVHLGYIKLFLGLDVSLLIFDIASLLGPPMVSSRPISAPSSLIWNGRELQGTPRPLRARVGLSNEPSRSDSTILGPHKSQPYGLLVFKREVE